MKFTLRQLELFIALAETHQISRAASHCHISQSSMTIAMRNLESALNTQLFVRHAKGVRVTAAGERLLAYARKIISDSQAAFDDLQNKPETAFGICRIGISETLSAYLLPQILHDVEQRFPLVDLQFVEAPSPALIAQLRNRQIDFALLLTSNITHDSDLKIETFMRSPRRLWACSGHPLLSKTALLLEDVEKVPFILLSTDEYPGVISEYWKGHGTGPDVFFRTNSFEAVRSFVAQGKGVTILSDLVYRPWSLDGLRVMRRTIDNSITYMDTGVVTLDQHALSPSHRQLIDFIGQLCSRLDIKG
ncbi:MULTISPECIES: LysR family transcriptional regulator [Pantoea]|jgi:DNA-binding transcriptional LysR family regulator|uniref:LysR family transcriptional regulator n=2 Tax=Erwiniaceae TaxID=1903409 RepID=UPI00066106F7|nr:MULTISPECIES: LysR family transcriptional regulator [Pantoea]MBS6438001.1 LysR family transcriptional regulator [Pantoea sp.]MDU1572757.1 LysR family transcriptional regulator [Pantoea sp.]MDU2727900.1 LysR family transcriptional regulator [Pantoea sp.]MDU5473040.1 LysR family transcriptional regulator [Pantoea sp.]